MKKTLGVAAVALLLFAVWAPGQAEASTAPSFRASAAQGAPLAIKSGRTDATRGTEQLFRGDLIPEIGIGCSNIPGTSGGPNDIAVGVDAVATPPFDIISTTYNIFTNVSPTLNALNFQAWAGGGASPGASFASQGGLAFSQGNHTAVINPAINVSAANAPNGVFFFGLNQPQANAGFRVGVDSSSPSAGTSFIRAPGCGASSFFSLDGIGYPGNWVMAAVIDVGAPAELLALDDTTILGQPGAVDACTTDSANDNGIIEPGEGVYIPFELRAQGTDFSGITGSLVSNSGGVSVIDGVQSYPNIASGGTSGPNAPFTIFVDEATACGGGIDLTLTVTANEGGPFVFNITGTVGAPLLPPSPLPLVIPDSNPAGASSTLTVAQSVVLSDVNVSITATHSWVGDLVITLTPPGGSPITLMDQPGVPASGFGCSNNDIAAVFDDSAGTPVEGVCSAAPPAIGGSVIPQASLAGLNGTNAQGNWVLTVSDLAGGDTGQVTDWQLQTTPPLAGVCNVCVGGQPPSGGAGGQSILEIPVLSKAGLAALALLLVGAAALLLRRRG
ncbi:MAG: proprotein convertase P-domain-containing protein [Thermoanaerobaculia bacterium]